MDSKPLVLTLVGDMMLGRSFNDAYANNPYYKWIFDPVRDFLRDSDLMIGNLETTITISDNKWPKEFNFKINPEYFRTMMDKLGLSNRLHFSLANNHSLDYGANGLSNTINILRSLGITYSGVGSSFGDAMIPAIRSINGILIALFSGADHPSEWKAGTYNSHRGMMGINIINIDSSQDRNIVIGYIKSFRKQFKGIIIFSLHWGPNYQKFPSPIFQEFAHQLIDAGVNIIHGHSAHHLQLIEQYNGGIICYSLGDFIDDYKIDDQYRNDLALALKIKIDPISLSISGIEFLPTKIDSMKVMLSSSDEISLIRSMIQI